MSDQPRGRDRVRRLAGPLRALEWAVGRLPGRTRRSLLRFHTTSDGLAARAVRFAALRSTAASAGELIDIRSLCLILAPQGLRVGSRVSIHPFCYLDATGGITIGDDVSIAHGTSILSTNHSWDDPTVPIRDQPVTAQATTIEDDVWIGAGVRIMAGTTIGRGSVVAAGAVVTADVPPRTIVAGVPARAIRSLDVPS